jgi:hypothetical protein
MLWVWSCCLASRPDDLDEGAFAQIAGSKADAVLVSADSFMLSNREALVGLATRYKIPAVYQIREFAAGDTHRMCEA